ncbi:alpha/beta fold hydrolase [Actomonas aquatica]|uniref:Alpha/beta fold hydrolase n=1 Tax=Actomonas aquatica TaxID=2866162 RepID=A0ABZ1C8T9_9BACT|nr:alpha/beta fold hydrolase [Opitutus sp. WL0086]WRQ87906.1 alpha/beta fold hydrolase [Opitutus sp. WL0086]
MKLPLKFSVTPDPIEVSDVGRTLVLLHSLGCDRQLWDGVVAQWQGRRRIVAVDLPGHGESPLWPAGFSLEDCADAVVAVLDTLGVERAIWAGNSVGGMIVQAAALNHAERVQAVVLSATDARIGTTESWNQRLAQIERDGLASMAGSLAERWFGEAFRRNESARYDAIVARLASQAEVGYTALAAAIRDADFGGRMAEITQPALVIGGGCDLFCPPDAGLRLAAALPRGEFELLPAAGHQPPVECPAEWGATVERSGVFDA